MPRRFLGCMLLMAVCALPYAGAQSQLPASASSAASAAPMTPASVAALPASDALQGLGRTTESGASSNTIASDVAGILLAVGALLLAGSGVYLIVAGLARRTPEGFSFRRHMGGFGGGSTGWQLSEQLVSVLCGLVLVVLATAVAMQTTVVPVSARTDAKGFAAAGASAASAAK